MMDTLVFVGAAAFLVVLVLVWLLYPLLRGGRTALARAKGEGGSETAAAVRRQLNAAIYRDQLAEITRDREAGELAAADYEQAYDELQHRLLQEVGELSSAAAGSGAAPGNPGVARRSALFLALVLPLAAAALYFWLGTPAALQKVDKPRITAEQIDGMVAKLAERLAQNPDDLKGWMMLARSYEALQRFEDAASAFEHVMRLGGDKNPDLLTHYADLLGVMAQGRLEGKPLALVDQALKIDPEHLTALALAGSAAYSREDFKATLDYWGRLLKLLPKESEEAKQLAAKLDEIRAKQGK